MSDHRSLAGWSADDSLGTHNILADSRYMLHMRKAQRRLTGMEAAKNEDADVAAQEFVDQDTSLRVATPSPYDCLGLVSRLLTRVPLRISQYVRRVNFANCTLLTSVAGLPYGVDIAIFSGCTSLVSVIGLPSSVSRVFFSGCSALTSVAGLPRSVQAADFTCCRRLRRFSNRHGFVFSELANPASEVRAIMRSGVCDKLLARVGPDVALLVGCFATAGLNSAAHFQDCLETAKCVTRRYLPDKPTGEKIDTAVWVVTILRFADCGRRPHVLSGQIQAQAVFATEKVANTYRKAAMLDFLYDAVSGEHEQVVPKGGDIYWHWAGQWRLRDWHTVDEVIDFFTEGANIPRVIVWEIKRCEVATKFATPVNPPLREELGEEEHSEEEHSEEERKKNEHNKEEHNKEEHNKKKHQTQYKADNHATPERHFVDQLTDDDMYRSAPTNDDQLTKGDAAAAVNTAVVVNAKRMATDVPDDAQAGKKLKRA